MMEQTTPPSILIVDDMPINIQILSVILGEEKYRITATTEGARALELARDGSFDLILLDVEMPGLSGFDVCRILKLSESTRDIPVIFITARNNSEDIIAGFESGAVDYITKPFNKPELMARIKTHLELKKSREEMVRAYEKLREKDTLISDDLRRAREIQQSVIAFKGDGLGDIDVGVHFTPMIEVGGDIFDIYRRDSGECRIFLADATGHGIQAALVTMLIKGEYDKIKNTKAGPGEILSELNDSFYNRYYRLSVLFTACVADLSPAFDRLTLASAGHPSPYVLSPDVMVPRDIHGPMLGIRERVSYPQAEHPFLPGDSFVVFTDGLCEDLFQRQGNMDMAHVEELFGKHRDKKPGDFVDAVVRDMLARLGEEAFSDDITLIMARRN